MKGDINYTLRGNMVIKAGGTLEAKLGQSWGTVGAKIYLGHKLT